MKFLIAGYGSIGRRHMRNLQTLGETDIILYRTGKSTLPEDELDGFIVETDIHAALAHTPDAIIIANPTSLHLDAAIPAAKAGCHVLMEKPIAQNLDQIEGLIQALNRGGGRLLMGFQFRFHPGLRLVEKFIKEGQIGRPLSFHVHSGEYMPAWHPWEDYRKGYSARSDLGGGIILTQCHALDYLRWLLGEVEEVDGFVGKISDLEIDVDDVAEIYLKFASGAVGSVHLDGYQQPPEHYLEIIGTQGTIKWFNNEGSVSLYTRAKAAWETFPLPKGFDRNDMFLEEMRHFLDVINGIAVPHCSLEDGIRVMEVILKVKGEL
jgi:predicted dehydrogenase